MLTLYIHTIIPIACLSRAISCEFLYEACTVKSFVSLELCIIKWLDAGYPLVLWSLMLVSLYSLHSACCRYIPSSAGGPAACLRQSKLSHVIYMLRAACNESICWLNSFLILQVIFVVFRTLSATTFTTGYNAKHTVCFIHGHIYK